MGVLHSIPLCSRGTNNVEPLNLDNNNNESITNNVHTSQPNVVVVPPPEATSTPRPQGTPTGTPTGLQNEQYSDSLSDEAGDVDEIENEIEEPQNGGFSDSGLEESATEFEFSRPSPPGGHVTSDEGVHEEFEDTLILDGSEEIDLNDEDPLERPPEPTVPDERVSSSSDNEVEPGNSETGNSEAGNSETGNSQDEQEIQGGLELDDESETARKISTILTSLVGDRPSGEDFRPDLVPSRR